MMVLIELKKSINIDINLILKNFAKIHKIRGVHSCFKIELLEDSVSYKHASHISRKQ